MKYLLLIVIVFLFTCCDSYEIPKKCIQEPAMIELIKKANAGSRAFFYVGEDDYVGIYYISKLNLNKKYKKRLQSLDIK